jgi:TM2 domain-containing membrane protein YozV
MMFPLNLEFPGRLSREPGRDRGRIMRGRVVHVFERRLDLSEKRKLPAFLLCLFFGFFGVHRYYVGKVATGVLELLTFGGLGVWWFLDLIVILLGGFTDKEGRLITKWV